MRPQTLPWLLAADQGRNWGAAAIWIGVAGLTLGVLFLTRTRWGRAQPLTKCAMFSIVAHVLFAIYAATVHVLSTPSATPRETVRISFVDQPGDDGNAALAQETPPAASAPPSKPAPKPAPQTKQAKQAQASPPPDRARRAPADGARSAPPPVPNAKRGKERGIKPPSATATLQPDSAAPRPREPATNASASSRRRAGKNSQAGKAPGSVASRRPVPSPSLTGVEPWPPWRDPEPLLAPSQSREPPAPFVSRANARDKQPGPSPRPREQSATNDNAVEPAPSTREPVVDYSPPDIYKLRQATDQDQIAEKRGGSSKTQLAVRKSLQWLDARQSPDGRWDASSLEAGRNGVIDNNDRNRSGAALARAGAGRDADTGITGLAVLAYLGSGHTHRRGEHRQAVREAIEYLRTQQAADGNLGGGAKRPSMMYCHGMALFALSEAYAMTGDPELRDAVENGRRFTLKTQHPQGGWRYEKWQSMPPRDFGDTSQLGWQLMALKSADLGGRPIPAASRDAMANFLRMVSSGKHAGIAAYQRGQPASRAMTAEALVCRQFLGIASREQEVEAAAFLLQELPSAATVNHYYWYYATLALYQMQGAPWHEWNAALATALVETQRQDGEFAGSWDPDKASGQHGGRVFSTALCALCLEVYYRYLPMYVDAAGGWKGVK